MTVPGGSVTPRRSTAAWCVAVLAVAGTATAEPSSLVLNWTAPPGCPAAPAIRDRVGALIGANVDALPRGPFVVTGTIAVDGGAARLHLDTLVPAEHSPAGAEPEVVRGSRDLAGATCEEVSAAGALVIALAIDPKAVEEQAKRGPVAGFPEPAGAEPPPPPGANTALPALPPPSNPVVPKPGERPPEPPPAPSTTSTSGQVAGRMLGELGALPGASLGVGLGAGFSLNRFIVRVEGMYFFPRFAEASTPAADGRARGANVSLAAFDVGGCYVAVPGELELDLCAAVEPGALLAVGSHFDRTTSAVATWLAAGASAEFTWNVAPPLSVRAGVGAMVPFGRSRVTFTEITDTSSSSVSITRPGWVSGRASVGAGLSF